MKAVLIDPTEKTITNVEYETYEDMKRLLGDVWLTSVSFRNNCVVYVDDEGLLKDKPGPFFQIYPYPQPLAGRGLVCGVDSFGESRSSPFNAVDLLSHVTFPAVRFVGFKDEFVERHGIFVISREAIFEPLP